MISIRLSEEEYSTLRRLCLVSGARSVSDLARDAMRLLTNGGIRDNGFVTGLDEFRAQMRDIDKKIEQLAAEVTAIKPEINH
jgi:hypothetical protein